jgi:hypothetical protein
LVRYWLLGGDFPLPGFDVGNFAETIIKEDHMAAPKIFISSTCYDLKYIRENLKFFIRSFGYEPILSEEGAVYFDPSMHVQDACMSEVASCQIFVLIIGGRHGSNFRDGVKSITNHEFLEAKGNGIPVFALVEQGVYDQFMVYQHNKSNLEIDASKIKYPSVDSTKIFDFIVEVQSQSINNALVPFGDFEGIQKYLKQQWASMLYRYLTTEGEGSKVRGLLEEIRETNSKIEFLSRQVVRVVGDPITQLWVKAYDCLINEEVTHNLSYWGIKPAPSVYVRYATLDELCGEDIVYGDEDEDEGEEEYGSFSLTYGGPPYKAGKGKVMSMRSGFLEVREQIMKLIENQGVSVEDFLRLQDQ